MLSNLKNSYSAYKILNNLTDNEVLDFLDSYEYFGTGNETTKHLTDYYRVIHPLCTISSDVEKMYIPPAIDNTKSVYNNQLLFEKKLVEYCKIKETDVLFDLGCGCGKIALNINELSDAKVIGVNIDSDQIKKGNGVISNANKADKVTLTVDDFNNLPLKYEDNSFDYVYCIQACTYMLDKKNIYKEVNRILKKNGRFIQCMVVTKDEYFEAENLEHQRILKKSMEVMGGVTIHTDAEILNILNEANFTKIEMLNWNSSEDTGAMIIQQIYDKYKRIRGFVKMLCRMRIFSRKMNVLIERLMDGSDELVMAHQMKILQINQLFISTK
tara:strand:- start:3139 stop:4119 length:981 start_codon:yes stop_codon:yes gene_type:complete